MENSTSGKITFKSTTIQCKFDCDFQFEKNKHERMMKNMEWSDHNNLLIKWCICKSKGWSQNAVSLFLAGNPNISMAGTGFLF